VIRLEVNKNLIGSDRPKSRSDQVLLTLVGRFF
jgi:hypothetical protein